MPLTTITVTGSYPAGAGSGVATGYVTFVPTARIVNAAGHTIIPQLPIEVQLQLGAFSLPDVVTTDNAGLAPSGWAWEVTENIDGIPAEPYYVFIPSSYGETVDVSELTEATPGPVITAYANLAAENTFTEANTFSGGITVAGGLELDDTVIAAPPGGTTEFLRADGTWDVPAGSGGVQIGTDLGGTDDAPQVISTHLTDPLPAAQGGTGFGSVAAAGIVTTTGAATTVQPGTSYGTGSAVGTDTTYAREDHEHGTPALSSSAPATTEAIAQAGAAGSATTPARADHVHPLAAASTPTTSAVTDAASTGNATTFAAGNHVHGREGFGTVTALSSFGTASGSGTAATVSHSDHVHGAPALPGATTSAAGIVQIDGTAAHIQPLGAQAAGASGLGADSEHIHPTTGLVLASSLPLATTSGGTGQNTAAAAYNTLSPMTTPGDIEYESGANTAARLPGNTSAAKNFLTQTGTGSASAPPAWGVIAYADIPLPNTPVPDDQNLVAWTLDPAALQGGTVLASGTVYLSRVILRRAQTVTNILMQVFTAGTGLTTGENLIGLYGATGTLLSGSADQTTAWASTGLKTIPLSTVQTNLAAGTYYAAMLSVGATPVSPGRGYTGSTSTVNAGLSAATYRWATGPASQTSLPSSIAMSGNSSSSVTLWVALD